MAITRDWNESDPSNSDKLGTGASDVRDLRLDIEEREVNGGHAWNQATFANDGRHNVADGFKVYKADRTTVAFDYTDGAQTAASGVNFVGGNVTTGDDPGHTHTRTIIVVVPGVIVPGRFKTTFRAPRAITFTEARLLIWTRPTTGTLTIDIAILSATGLTDDPNATGATTIFSSKPTVTAANYRGSSTGFSTTSMTAGQELVFSADAGGFTGSPADLTIQLIGKIG